MLQDIGDAFVRGREAGGLCHLREVFDSINPLVKIRQRNVVAAVDVMHGIKNFSRNARLLNIKTPKPVANKIVQGLDDGIFVQPGHRLQANCNLHSMQQTDLEPAFDQDSYNTERRASQPERVLVASGLFAKRENAGESIELVSERQDLTGRRVRNDVASKPR